MANLNETDQWEAGIYQWEEDDPVLGGPSGIDNRPPRELANRSRYQRLRNVTPWDAALTYPANVAYVSYGGTTWKSVGESLNVAPGTDPAKWVRWGFTLAELNASLGDAVAAHEAKPDPHPQYATDADLAAHLAAPNPHPLYATDADLAAHVADANPHPVYATDADLSAHATAANPHSQYVRHDAAQGLTVGQKQQARDNIGAEESGAAARLALGSRVKGLTGNTVGPGFTTATFSAAEVLMRNPTTGGSLLALNVGPLVCNINAAGPAANGRDQAAPFSNNTWLHLWFISDGITVATLASVSATAPTLPAGYVAQAYIGAVRLGTGTLADVSFRGNRTIYSAGQSAFVNGTASAPTSISVATLVPPNAETFDLQVQTIAVSTNGSGGYSATAYIGTSPSASQMYVYGIGGVAVASQIMSVAGQTFEMPNVGQQFHYFITLAAGSGTSTGINVNGYKNPNGGE